MIFSTKFVATNRSKEMAPVYRLDSFVLSYASSLQAQSSLPESGCFQTISGCFGSPISLESQLRWIRQTYVSWKLDAPSIMTEVSPIFKFLGMESSRWIAIRFQFWETQLLVLKRNYGYMDLISVQFDFSSTISFIKKYFFHWTQHFFNFIIQSSKHY